MQHKGSQMKVKYVEKVSTSRALSPAEAQHQDQVMNSSRPRT